MKKKIALSKEDKKAWEDYIKNPSGIYDKDKTKSVKVGNKNRFKFDLHGFTLDEANNKVKELVIFCIEKKYKEILFITGKGNHSTNVSDIYVSKHLGKLKYSVPEFIKTNPELNKFIISINDAEKKDGGKGALIIKLKNL